MAFSAPPSKTSFNLSPSPKSNPFGAIRVGRKPKRTSSIERTSISTPPFSRGRRSKSLGGNAFPYSYTESPSFPTIPRESSPTGGSFFRRLAGRFRSGKPPPAIDTQLIPPVIPVHRQSSLPTPVSAKQLAFRSPGLRIQILPSRASRPSVPLTPPRSTGPENLLQRATEAERFRTWTFARAPTPTTPTLAQYPYTPADSQELLPPPALRDPATISLPSSPCSMNFGVFNQPRNVSGEAVARGVQLALFRGDRIARAGLSSPLRVKFGDHGSTFVESGLFDDDESNPMVTDQSDVDMENYMEDVSFEPRETAPPFELPLGLPPLEFDEFVMEPALPLATIPITAGPEDGSAIEHEEARAVSELAYLNY